MRYACKKSAIDGANDNQVEDDENDDHDDDDNDGADEDDVVVVLLVCLRIISLSNNTPAYPGSTLPRNRESFTLHNRGLSEMAPQRTIHSQAKGQPTQEHHLASAASVNQ